MKKLEFGAPVASSGWTTGVVPGLNHHRSAKSKGETRKAGRGSTSEAKEEKSQNGENENKEKKRKQ